MAGGLKVGEWVRAKESVAQRGKPTACDLHCNREMKWNCTVTAEKVAV